MIKAFIRDIFPFYKKENRVLSQKEKMAAFSWYGVAFLIPFVFVLSGAIVREIAPFGENTLMAIDAWDSISRCFVK